MSEHQLFPRFFRSGASAVQNLLRTLPVRPLSAWQEYIPANQGLSCSDLTIMNDTHPWRRAFTCGGVIFAALMGFAVLLPGGDLALAFRAGYVAATVGIPVIITGFWASGSDKEWSWFRHALTVVMITVLFVAIRVGPTLAREGHVSARQSNPYAKASGSQNSSYQAYSSESGYQSLKLGMISGMGSNRIATINGQPFAQGESHALTIDSTKRVVHCTAIRDQSVLLTISGDSQPHELKIGEPLPLNQR